jgi:hypothetical protein
MRRLRRGSDFVLSQCKGATAVPKANSLLLGALVSIGLRAVLMRRGRSWPWYNCIEHPMDLASGEFAYDIQLQPGEALSLPKEAAKIVGPGHWLVSVRPVDHAGGTFSVRDYAAFSNSYAPEDGGLYDDSANFRLDSLERSLFIGRIGMISPTDDERVRQIWSQEVKPQF